MSLPWSLCQKYNARHCLLAAKSPVTYQAPRTLAPPPALKRLQPPSSWPYWLSRQDRRRLYNTAQSLLTQSNGQSSHAELQGEQQGVHHELEPLKAPRSPNIVLDYGYGGSNSRKSRFDHTESREAHNSGNQTISDPTWNSLEPEEMDSLSDNTMIPESTGPRTAAHGVNSSSPQDCYTPSEAILYSLGSLSRMYTTFEDFSNKIDLSTAKGSTVACHGPYNAKSGPRRYSRKDSMGSFFPYLELSLPRLLAEYLQSCRPTRPCDIAFSEDLLQNVFSEENLAFIRNEGFEPEDLVSWAWIVTADSTDLAVGRLIALSADFAFGSSESRVIPTFVFLLVLRRSDWNAGALRMMILHGWHILEWHLVAREQPLDPLHEFSKTRAHSLQPRGIGQRFMSEKNLVLMVIRLLRQARIVWPEACVSITTMLTRHEGKSWDTALKGSPTSELTYLYNTILGMLALPVSKHPFFSISAQQQAQFIIIRRMNEFDPPLAVDREGYRAVARVQLAHKKTLQERDWASLKAKSWPPWKRDKLGLDAEKDFQYGQSRASQAIRQSEEAGYALKEQESSAKIQAGWDTDKSPTIQTRTLGSRPVMSRNKTMSLRPATDLLEWTARIQATRTIDEAWACFLAYKDSMSGARIPSKISKVYNAMAEKIILEGRRSRATEQDQLQKAGPQSEDITPLPGDGKLVFERPGPQEAIYVRSSPPDLDNFFDMMLRDKIFVSPRSLALFLPHVTSFKQGIHYLLCSQLPNTLVQTLLVNDPTSIACPIHHERLPNYLFAAFIHYLCRFAQTADHPNLTDLYLPETVSTGTTWLKFNPLVQACRLMSAYKPYYPPPWHSLLWVLAKKGVWVEAFSDNVNPETQDILAWKAILRIVDDMQMIGLGLDFKGFRYVCVGYEKAIMAQAALTDAADLEHVRGRLDCDVEVFIHNGLSYIKDLFKRIVFGGAWHQVTDVGISVADCLLPRLLETPSPALIHPLIRILGLRGDHGGLVELVEWMAEFAPELQARSDEAMNGKRMLRRCLTAAVIFLEQSWLPPGQRVQYGEHWSRSPAEESGTDSGTDSGRTIHRESTDDTKNISAGTLVQRFRRAISENPEWGGWPSAYEIDVYMGRYETDTLGDVDTERTPEM